MSNKLYIIKDSEAVKMEEQKYELEKDLQEIIEKNPQLLIREWGGTEDHKLYLVKREQIVWIPEDGGNSFSLDHLLVDDESVPTLVEVKRSTDTRSRRLVVAQMLDYACRIALQDINDLREEFRENNKVDEDADLQQIYDNDAFWEQLETNLKAEHFRMVFVADEIPDTLRVLIEFLDRSMSNIEVYGVEIRRYAAGDENLLSSNVIGNSLLDTRKAVQLGTHSSRSWTIDEFLACMKERGLSDQIPVIKDLRAFGEEIGGSIVPGVGGKNPSYVVKAGKRYLYSVTAEKNDYVNHCMVCIPIYLHAPLMGEDWDVDKLRRFITDLPGKEEAERNKYIWYPEKWQFIDLRALIDPRNLEKFKQNIRDVYTAVFLE